MNQEVYNKQKKFFKKSKKDVILFEGLAIDRGYNIITPSDEEDYDEFWDTGIEKDNKVARVQVKGYTDAHKNGYVWVELKSVQKDDYGRNIAGWLYGKANVLALLFKDSFGIYHMGDLKEYVEKMVNFDSPTLVVKIFLDDGKVDYEKMKYREYDRRGDVMVAIPLKDIEKFKIDNWKSK